MRPSTNSTWESTCANGKWLAIRNLKPELQTLKSWSPQLFTHIFQAPFSSNSESHGRLPFLPLHVAGGHAVIEPYTSLQGRQAISQVATCSPEKSTGTVPSIFITEAALFTNQFQTEQAVWQLSFWTNISSHAQNTVAKKANFQ